MQKEVLPSHKLGDHAYEYYDPFILKENNPSHRNCQNQLSHPDLYHIEQECQESLIQGKIHNQNNFNEGLEVMRFKVLWFIKVFHINMETYIFLCFKSDPHLKSFFALMKAL